MLKNKTILITGGTGTLGKTFTPMTLKKYNPKKIIIFSRDEMKQWEMAKLFKDDSRVRFIIGDVRDKDRLYRALDDVDYVVHAAALKIVPTAEYDPFECVKTNVIGAMNLIDACIDKKVKRIISLSTDKASNPVNLYGSTKLTSDKLFVSSNNYSGAKNTIFSVVRYGNVMGSRGSVIPFFMSMVKDNYFPITDSRMTRFMLTTKEAVELIWYAFEDMKGGEIYIKKTPLIIKGSLKRYRNLTYIKDCINILSESIKNKKLKQFEIFNLSNGLKVTVERLVKEILKVNGKKKWKIINKENTPGDSFGTDADVSYLKKQFNNYKFLKLEEGLKRYFLWIEKIKKRSLINSHPYKINKDYKL